ncbi:hypothetical protein C8Q76DRAFT_581172, partial [Earliella scabrosa]
ATSDLPPDGSTPYWSTLQASILFFPPHSDPFSLPSKTESQAVAAQRKKLQKRVLTHAGRVFARQHRTHLFLATVSGGVARLVRCDREAVFATHALHYTSTSRGDWAKLADFFARFAAMSASERGFDPTATVLGVSDPRREFMLRVARTKLEGAADHARRCFMKSLDDPQEWPWVSIQVCGAEFLVGQPHSYMEHLLGRPSRGYVALVYQAGNHGIDAGSFVWLKDTWRRKRGSEYEQEGAVLADLNRCGAQGVPTLVCHEDVLDHRIDLYDITDRVYKQQRDSSKPKRDIELVQYRVVVKEVGMKVDAFRNSKELVQVILDCVKGHRDAYELAGILHRDISAGNLLIVPIDGPGNEGILYKGVLNDWELAERISRRTVPGFVYPTRRRGTWEFLSVSAMDHPERPVQAADEVESFIHVLVSFAIAYVPHNCRDAAAFDVDYCFCEKTDD